MILAKRPEVDRFLTRPDAGIRAAVIHGKDRSGVAERAEILCRAITPDLNDPFNVTVLTDSDIDGDEARLEEALTALSMIGGRRLVRVRLGADKAAIDRMLAAALKTHADGGYNPDAMLALVQAVQAMPATRRSVVISGAGDRRDQDIRQQTEILGGAFDEVVLYEDQCQRGRKDGEVIALLREGLANASRTTSVSEIHGEFLAIDTAMDKLQAGELCLILVDQVAEALAYIANKVKGG